MFKYIMEFSKTGTICYISHLDLIRVFVRAFKKSGIKLNYSKGFNPHPKMGFAQPLSLGYRGLKEYIEFETKEEYTTEYLLETMAALMPEGIEVIRCDKAGDVKKTLAALTESAEYIIYIPLDGCKEINVDDMRKQFLSQNQIIQLKKRKKKKDLVEVDIKPMIRQLEFSIEGGSLRLETELDSGSSSNLSPELLINAVIQFFGINILREEVEVTRTKINFLNL